jgi:hypothetical protein
MYLLNELLVVKKLPVMRKQNVGEKKKKEEKST